MQNLAFVIVALLAALAISRCNAAATVRMQLTHADAGRGLAARELMQRMALRSKARAERRLSSPAGAPVSPGDFADGLPTFSEYLVHLSIGTPPQPVQLRLDTGSYLIWDAVPAVPRMLRPGSLPYFDPSASSTFSLPSCDSTLCQGLPVASCGSPKFWPNQTCVYTYSYGDKTVTTGLLEVDKFTFGASASVPGVAFGRGLFNNGVFKSNETGIATSVFSAPLRAKPDVPKLVLHFEGATMDLPRENYVFEVEDAGSSIVCLAIIEGGEVTTICNFHQQNTHVLYDLQNSKLSFVPAQCDKL